MPCSLEASAYSRAFPLPKTSDSPISASATNDSKSEVISPGGTRSIASERQSPRQTPSSSVPAGLPARGAAAAPSEVFDRVRELALGGRVDHLPRLPGHVDPHLLELALRPAPDL